jgi:outer membrane lipoprotein carrier protein
MRWFRIALSLWIAAGCLAVPAEPAGARRIETAVDILRGIEEHYGSFQAYSADFSQWTTSAAASTMTTEAHGTFYFQRPKRMRWEYRSPEPQAFVAVEDFVWLLVPEEHQVSLFDSRDFFSSPIMKTLFDGFLDLANHFTPVLDDGESSREVAVLTLTPKKEDPNLQSLRIHVARKTFDILRIETRDALGNTNRLDFQNHRKVERLPDTLFRLEAGPDTLVLDADGRRLERGEVLELQRKIVEMGKEAG